MYNNFKRLIAIDVYFYTCLIILVSLLSFALGRYSVQPAVPAVIPSVTYTQLEAVATVSSATQELKSEQIQKFVASKKGTKYHLLSCPGAKQMNEDNKIFFNTKKDAEAAGYTPAGNCSF